MRFALLALVCACTASAKTNAEWSDGCFMMIDASGKRIESDHDRCDKPRRPYSTFKIANALIGVDAGLLDGPDAQMTWDKTRVPDEKKYLDSWRKPHTLRTGIAVSAVPYFKTLALDLGEEKMKAGLKKLGYGNQDMSGGLDKFWLVGGGLRISAREQLAFVEALAQKKLGVSEKAQTVVGEVTILETRGKDVLHGKTGSGPIEDGKGGWLVWQVGWVEKEGGGIVAYAMWIDSKLNKLDDARAARDKRLRKALADAGVFPM
jgi:beta-lactamase class D